MFGVMFGDIGHGGLLLVVAYFGVKNNDKLSKNPDLAGVL
jgi:V-type H+-transporting ATPase subunit a